MLVVVFCIVDFNSDVSDFSTNVNDYNQNSEAGTGTVAAVYLGSFRMAQYLNYFPSLSMTMKDDFFSRFFGF